jgi:UDP-N-acetyl-2-amino-2-deoxyglucuronate dehydrogenase
MADRVRLGVLGCGATTRVMYGPIFRYLENGVFVAACDPNVEQAQWAADAYGATQVFDDPATFLAEAEVDAVIVGSPVWAHAENVIAAAAAGKHVLCEKPMARTVEECDAMAAACADAGVTLMVAFMKRFNKCFARATEMVHDGTLGDVFQVRALWSFWTPPGGWRDSLRTWGGVYQDHGSHAVDLCRAWLGDIATVKAEIDIIDPDGRDVEDRAVALYRHAGGGVSLHEMTRVYHKPLIEGFEILGTKAALDVEFGPAWSYSSAEPFTMTLYRDGRSQENVTPYNQGNMDDELRQNAQYLRELAHFCDCVLTGEAPKTSPADGRAAIEAVTAAYVSSATGETVALPLTESPDMERMFREMKSAR